MMDPMSAAAYGMDSGIAPRQPRRTLGRAGSGNMAAAMDMGPACLMDSLAADSLHSIGLSSQRSGGSARMNSYNNNQNDMAAAGMPTTNPKMPKNRMAMDSNKQRKTAGAPGTRPDQQQSGKNRNAAQDSIGEDNELTLEKYRQQLEEYVLNHTNQNNNIDTDPIFRGNDLHLSANNDEVNDSDLEDDWEKEKERAYRQLKERNSGEKQRGVNRNVSGLSAMFGVTKGSGMGMSLSSGLSGLSDMISANTEIENVNRENRMSMARSVSSNLSIMSELTDLSQNIDNLSLYDDDEE
jgi:hypothetical protein